MLVMSKNNRKNKPIYSKLSKQKGFSLIEVMVAFFVLAGGILGMSSLMANSVKGNQSAYYRTQAVTLAQDMAGRMRANREENYNYSTGGGAGAGGCYGNNACNSAALAADDYGEWEALVTGSLPLGEGVICQDTSPDDGTGVGADGCEAGAGTYAVKIWWDDNRDGVVDGNDPRVSIEVIR